MTIFEIITSVGLGFIVLILIAVAWFLRQGLIKPLRETKKEETKLTEAKVERAKVELESRQASETRMVAKVKESKMDDSLDKLRTLRRK